MQNVNIHDSTFGFTHNDQRDKSTKPRARYVGPRKIAGEVRAQSAHGKPGYPSCSVVWLTTTWNPKAPALTCPVYSHGFLSNRKHIDSDRHSYILLKMTI